MNDLMKLEDFIKNTITEIVNGVSSAQRDDKYLSSDINPEIHSCESVDGMADSSEGSASLVHFDIAISAN